MSGIYALFQTWPEVLIVPGVSQVSLHSTLGSVWYCTTALHENCAWMLETHGHMPKLLLTEERKALIGA